MCQYCAFSSVFKFVSFFFLSVEPNVDALQIINTIEFSLLLHASVAKTPGMGEGAGGVLEVFLANYFEGVLRVVKKQGSGFTSGCNL